MRYLLLILVSVIALKSSGQQMTYGQWKEEARTDIRLLPQYGNVKKTNEQVAEDKELIDEEVKQYGSHRKASDTLISFGFNNLYSGDIRKAMYRFNQAWLLDPKNENDYWGFASVYFSFNDYEEALKQLNKGLLINPNSSNILTDKATIYTGFYVNKHDINYLNQAVELFNKSYRIDPSNQNTLFKLSVAYYYKKDCTNAWRFYNECKKLGGRPITQGYTDALKQMCAK